MRHMIFSIIITGMVLLSGCNTEPETSARPNIVWIVLEDITPMMGCYGDEYAKTPVFDKALLKQMYKKKNIAKTAIPQRTERNLLFLISSNDLFFVMVFTDHPGFILA